MAGNACETARFRSQARCKALEPSWRMGVLAICTGSFRSLPNGPERLMKPATAAPAVAGFFLRRTIAAAQEQTLCELR